MRISRLLSFIGGVSLGVYTVLAVKAYRNLRAVQRRFPPKGNFLAVQDGVGAGTLLHYVSKGTGRPVILLHGNDGTLSDFTMSPLFESLAQHYHVVAFDRPGHGHSTAPRPLKPHEQTDVIQHAITKLKLESPIIVAHSWSGVLALQYGLKYQSETSGLVLISACIYADRDKFREPLLYRLLGTTFGARLLFPIIELVQRTKVGRLLLIAFAPSKAPPEYLEQFQAMLFRPSQVKAACIDEVNVNESLELIAGRYAELKIPITTVTSDRDPFVPPQQPQKLAAHLPNASCTLLEGASHELMFTHSDLLVELVKETERQALKAINKK